VSPPQTKKTILALFREKLERGIPGYAPIKAGLRRRSVFMRGVNKDLQLYVLVHWHPYEEKYSLEVGWNYKTTLDEIGSFFDRSTAMQDNAVIIPLGILMGDKMETWFNAQRTSEQIQKGELASLVDLSFQQLLEYGMPYLESVKRSRLKDK
jgi:hypothetical protein